MIQLMRLELKSAAPVLILFFIALIGNALLFRSPAFLQFGPSTFVMIVSLGARRSPWYLNLPWSRRKLAFYFLSFTALTAFISTLIFSGLFTILNRLWPDPISTTLDYFAVTSLFTATALAVSLMGPLARSNTQTQFEAASLYSRKSLAAYLIGAASLLTFVLFADILLQPVVVTAGFTLVFFGILLAFATIIVLPANSRRSLKTTLQILAAIAVIVPPATAIFVTNFAPPDSWAVDFSQSYLYRFPSFVAEDRALALFENSRSGSHGSVAQYKASISQRVSEEAWTKRTSRCDRASCIRLSSDVVPLESMSVEQVQNRFSQLMNYCFRDGKPDSHIIDCVQRVLDSERLTPWIQRLKAAGSLQAWANSSTEKTRMIASAFRCSDVQLKTAKTDTCWRP
jgi:hypothetical protein